MATSVGGVTFISQCDPVSPVSANRRHSKRKARASEAALMLWFKTFYETLSLPKLNGVAINERSEPDLRTSCRSLWRHTS